MSDYQLLNIASNLAKLSTAEKQQFSKAVRRHSSILNKLSQAAITAEPMNALVNLTQLEREELYQMVTENLLVFAKVFPPSSALYELAQSGNIEPHSVFYNEYKAWVDKNKK